MPFDDSSPEDILESNTLFHDAWRFFARASASGEVLELPEVSIAASHVTWAMMNAAFVPRPVETEEALRRAARAAAHYFAPHPRAWMLAVCEDWVPGPLRDRLNVLFAPQGLRPVLVATGMVAERLLPELRPPPRLRWHAASDSRGRCDLADINALSYDVPVATGRKTFDVPGLFTGDNRGYVGYRLDAAATCAAVLRGVGAAYVSMVATHPAHRQLGLAEAVMRHALAEARRDWGLERTVLHATPAGLSVYRRLGYRPVTRFRFFMADVPRASPGATM
jgi:ribosomal protein S18 acetylase RimI-like enzyme